MLSSKHFMIMTLSDDADTAARAQAIAATCENDLAILERWFACNYDDSPYGILVTVSAGKHLGGASNWGYTTSESSKIEIVGTYAPPGGPGNPILRDEMARMLFVAELAEILMQFTVSAWDPHNSMGEGLSILAAETLHPAGYYGTGSGPRIKQWLNGSRPDSITKSVEDDKDRVSYGCAALFLNYLRYQRLYSVERIVAAAGRIFGTVDKMSLAGVFARLTGSPAASAYKEFTDLLQAHIPLGTPFVPVRDNLFPLRDPTQRAVSFSSFDIESKPVEDPEVREVTLRAGPLCPAKVYSYHNVNESSQLTISGEAVAFAQPRFTWAINGVPLAGRLPQLVPVTMTATDTLPGAGEPPVVASMPVWCVISSSGATSTLNIFNLGFPGNGDLTIT